MTDSHKLNAAVTALGNLRNLMDLAFNDAMEIDRVNLAPNQLAELNGLESLCLAARTYADAAIAEASKRAS